jgi:hypothetical protein
VVVPPVSLPGWLVLPPGWLVPPPGVPLEPLPLPVLPFSAGGADPLFPGDVGDGAGGVDGPGVPPPEPFDAPGPTGGVGVGLATGGVGFGLATGGVGFGFGFGAGAGAAFGFRGSGAGFAAGLGAAAGASPEEAVGAPEGVPPDALAPSPAPSWPLPTS